MQTQTQPTSKSLKSLSLSELNLRSGQQAFRLENFQIESSPLETESLWAPVQMAPLFYLESYHLLTGDQRRRYNQLFAAGVLEQFIWFEGALLAKVLERVIRKMPAGEFRSALEFFIADEEKHTEMFWRLLEVSSPDLYPKRELKFFKLGWVESALMQFLVRFPGLNLAWVWMAIFFEERTLDYSQQYIRFERQNPGILNKEYVLAHRLHLLDEVRHFQMDIHLLEKFYQPAGFLKKAWAGFWMRKLMKAYTRPRKVTGQILTQMQKEFPSLSDRVVGEIKKEAGELPNKRDFLTMAFGPKAVPRSRQLMAEDPRMAEILKIFDSQI